ncbi:tyrosine-type recombinase/integrase [Salinirubrum litoreum]|uniref:Tyrosine-type recombinase/integrase n=1 Tax=Salinirubrum litoreum TaxID=1126234 RepID=A0ABD5R6P5_9EURY|nr:tyrosine-type recombinase/integrase [Salinirubrum litoreum]
MKLKPTPPRDALTRYLRDKRTHVSAKSVANYKSTLQRFCDWLDDNGIHDLRDLDSEIIQQYTEYRLESIKPISARNDLRTITNYVRFCESVNAVPQGLGDLIRIPRVPEEDEVNDSLLTKEEADAILPHLAKFEYASDRHVIVLILWKTGMRISGLRALDVTDFDDARPALAVRHRPDTGTPLKRRSKGERDVLIAQATADVIRDYIRQNRPDVTDEYDREPLIATDHGRIVRTGIQRHVYTATRPCTYNGGDCPFKDDPADCGAMTWNTASKCPGSVSPHALRRGYVTAARNAGQPKDVTGERVNMSGRVLDKHYDKGNHADKAERRREFIRDV